ncbi:MAG: HAMP domain-containing histidine kinase [Lachnospiraceae bacterium]|nr:HAMP domain-containing histidine kinase [Lachnospiraceae bacterium]
MSSRSKKSGFWKVINSLYFRLVLVTLVITLVPLFILRQVILVNTWDNMWNDRMENMQTLGEDLAKRMVSYGYFNDLNTDIIHGQLNQVSMIYDGRAIVIDDTFTVKRDSYARINNKKVISEAAVKAMNGINTIEYSESYDMINLAQGINDGERVLGVLIISSSTSDLSALYDSIYNMSMIIMAVAAVVVAFLAFLFSRIITNPLKKVEKSINRISEGHYDEMMEVGGYSELEQVSDAFNAMLTKLNTLESSRQEFVSNVSHELKTPITSIKVLADSLYMQDNVPIETYKEFMKDIVDEIDRENTIITDLLSLVKMDQKSDDIMNITEGSVNSMLELILKRLKPIAERKNIELVLESFGEVRAQFDEVKLTLAFSNLIENGIKYNVAGGFVQVTIDSDNKYFFVKVADSGIGIPEELREKIFERFYRVDKARSRETGGTGLGLAITKNIILLHNGTISVSGREDEGTVFTVRLPLKYEKA